MRLLRSKLVPCLLCLLPAGAAGCALAESAGGATPAEVWQSISDYRERRERDWAEEAWAGVRSVTPEADYSPDYARGFKDGFTDHLCRGGDGQPPALPPPEYCQDRYRSPEGARAVADWFAGFRHGAAIARDGGFRRWLTEPPPEPAPRRLP